MSTPPVKLASTAALLPLLLAACGEAGTDTRTTADACTGGDNLVRDPAFTSLGAPRMQREWLASQHASDVSFSYSAENGVLTVIRTGDEPWFVLGQNFEGAAWAGKRIRFSAELKLDLVPEPTHDFRQGAGLMLRARKSGRVVLSSEFEHQPHMGQHDWQRVSITRDIPAKANSFRVGFQHQAGGQFQARNPQLTIVPAGCS